MLQCVYICVCVCTRLPSKKAYAFFGFSLGSEGSFGGRIFAILSLSCNTLLCCFIFVSLRTCQCYHDRDLGREFPERMAFCQCASAKIEETIHSCLHACKTKPNSMWQKRLEILCMLNLSEQSRIHVPPIVAVRLVCSQEHASSDLESSRSMFACLSKVWYAIHASAHTETHLDASSV